jgi:hypothetical protein
MTVVIRTEPFFKTLEAEHRNWLSSFDSRYLSNWERLLSSGEEGKEAAFAEAGVRRLLHNYQVAVEPNEDLDTGKARPDFRCTARGREFYVEVTCIPVAIATEKTGDPDVFDGQFRSFRPLTGAILAKGQDKAPQCANSDAPALVAVGTFHRSAAMSSFKKAALNWSLTGETKISWRIGVQTGKQIGDAQETTELHSAAFLRPDKNEKIGYARSSISGLLLIGLRLQKQAPLGLLHPNPVRPFDASTLPQVDFGQVVVDQASGQLRVDWPEEE